MQGGLCCCDAEADAASGHCETRIELPQEHDHGDGHSHEAVSHDACSGGQGADASCAGDCDSHTDCDCTELFSIENQVPVLGTGSSKQSIESAVLAWLPAATSLNSESFGFALASIREPVGRNHSPPLFLLYCTFLC